MLHRWPVCVSSGVDGLDGRRRGGGSGRNDFSKGALGTKRTKRLLEHEEVIFVTEEGNIVC